MDFDKLFEDFAIDYYRQHQSDFADEGELEAQIPELYQKWADTPSKDMGGLSPRAYFARYSTPQELMDQLKAACAEDGNPSSLLLDRIGEVPACSDALVQLLYSKNSDKLKMIAANLITELGGAHPLQLYTAWLGDRSVHSDLRELGVEILSENADAAADDLYALLPNLKKAEKEMAAEILVNARKDERTYQLLCELFASGDNIPLYAGYLGKYGDERASAMLYRALESCNYLEYIEIKNAIERMGGIVDDSSHDFSEDVYYKAIKNLK